MKKIFLFICLILMFISCGKFDRKKYSKKDLKKAATKLDARKLPDGEYEFYYFATDKENSANYDNSGYISYTFNIQDGKVVQDEDD